jgi:putative aminopeptidase FrvX
MNKRHQAVLQMVLAQPTAPFAEQGVSDAIIQWAGSRKLDAVRDSIGNVVIRNRGGGKGPGWVFAAHMDHPGFVATGRRGLKVQADFRGGVKDEFLKTRQVRFFTPVGQVLASVKSIRRHKDSPFVRCSLELDKSVDVPAGSIGMWDLPAWRISGRKLTSRACDDLVGCAGVLCAMEELARHKAGCEVVALLTRAEEVGFVGALAAAEAGSIDSDSMIVAIETSKAQPGAGLGDGVVIRVGDRSRTFDPSLTAHLSAVAEHLAKTDKKFRHTRQLMPGGTCESTAYAIWGYCATGLCLPLGNYHNMGNGKIASEQVDTGDFESMVKLLVALAKDNARPADTDRKLKASLAGTLAKLKPYF